MVIQENLREAIRQLANFEDKNIIAGLALDPDFRQFIKDNYMLEIESIGGNKQRKTLYRIETAGQGDKIPLKTWQTDIVIEEPKKKG